MSEEEPMSDEIIPNNLPLIRRRPGVVFVEPEGYVPDFHETASGKPVDFARLQWIAGLMLEEHEETERLTRIALSRPEWHVEAGDLRGEMLLAIRMDGEVIGLFEPELLDV